MLSNVASAESVTAKRLLDRPIITPELHASLGLNIQGPSLIRVPEWVENRLGQYYLYFADHKGRYIRLAYADDLTGPWKVHASGSLQLQQSYFLTEPPPVTEAQVTLLRSAYEKAGARISHDFVKEITSPHIASPDVHVDQEHQRIVMYFHGLEGPAHQVSRVALSDDGIHFQARPEILGKTYLRAFPWQGQTYALAMPGQFYRSEDGLSTFEKGPTLFNRDMRHCAVLVRGNKLWVFWTQVGDVPERIQLSTIDLSVDWMQWHASEPVEILRPEREWEGALAPLEPSVRSTAYGLVNQLRDPAIYVEGEALYLLYAVGGESGIAIAELLFPDTPE